MIFQSISIGRICVRLGKNLKHFLRSDLAPALAPSNSKCITGKSSHFHLNTPLSTLPQDGPVKILGIDEAGRGAVLGNLVIAGVSFKKTDINELINIGVKDSKKLTPKKREALFPEIMNLCKECKIIEVEPREIDDSVFDIKSNLNLLEIQKMGEIIDALKPSMVYIDAITSNPKKFTEMLKQHLVYKNTTIIAENKADELYPMVAAASIIAKVTRDRAIEALRKESKFQDIGSGYPSDPQTISSLKDWIKNRNIPFFVRKSWHTFVKMRDLQKNAKITQFFDVRGER